MKAVTEQRVMSFAQAQATASEIMAWKADLRDAQQDLTDAKETLEKSKPFRAHETAKERVKELVGRITEAEDALVEGVANSGK